MKNFFVVILGTTESGLWTLIMDRSEWSEKLAGTQMEPGNIYISNYIKLGKYIFSKL